MFTFGSHNPQIQPQFVDPKVSQKARLRYVTLKTTHQILSMFSVFPTFGMKAKNDPSYTNGKTRKRTAVLRVVFVPSYTNDKTRKHTGVLRVEKGRLVHFLIPFDGKALKGLRVTS